MDNEPDVIIKLADGTQLPAHSQVLRIACSCASGAPEPLSTLNLQELRIDGKDPPSKSVVSLWLEHLYQHLLPFTPSGNELTTSLQVMRSLLLFADAVGTNSLIMEHIADRVTELQLEVPLESSGSSWQLKLPLTGQQCYYFSLVNPLTLVEGPCMFDQHSSRPLLSLANKEHKDAVQKQAAAELEGWMYLANRLGLHKLCLQLQEFSKRHFIVPPNYTSYALFCPSDVLTERVLLVLDMDVLRKVWLEWMVQNTDMASHLLCKTSRVHA